MGDLLVPPPLPLALHHQQETSGPGRGGAGPLALRAGRAASWGDKGVGGMGDKGAPGPAEALSLSQTMRARCGVWAGCGWCWLGRGVGGVWAVGGGPCGGRGAGGGGGM